MDVNQRYLHVIVLMILVCMPVLAGCMATLQTNQSASPPASPASGQLPGISPTPAAPDPSMPTTAPVGIVPPPEATSSDAASVPPAPFTPTPLPPTAPPPEPTAPPATPTLPAATPPPTSAPLAQVPSGPPLPSGTVIVPATPEQLTNEQRWRLQQQNRVVFEAPQPFITSGSELRWYDPVQQQTVVLGTFRGPFEAQARFTLRGENVSALEVPYQVNRRYGLTAISPALIDRIQAAGYGEWIETYVIEEPNVQAR